MASILPGERLARFLRAVLPTEREVEIAQGRAARIAARLQNDMVVKRAIAVGSHWKGTAVRRYSDYDLFVVFSREEARRWAPTMTSNTLIGRVRRSIIASYPSTSLRIDQQAVKVSFEHGAHAVDVVPAVFDRFSEEHSAPVYQIPDGQGRWLTTSPDLHKRLVDDAQQRSGRKLKSLVRMLKWWSASRLTTYPLSSLYLEWFAIYCAIPVAYTYQESLAFVFKTLADTRLPPLSDPFAVSQVPVRPVATAGQLRAVVASAAQSARRALEALDAEDRGRFEAANERWSLVFNRRFPSSLF
jgi:hypothetical protein